MMKSRHTRTSELLSRAQNCRRRVFTVTEDKTIIKHVMSPKFDNDWESIAKLLPWRTARQCRDRWTYYLSPNNNLEPFSIEEDKMIVEKVNQLGTKWSIISKEMPGRSDNSIKNRWYSKLRSKCNIDDNGAYTLDVAKLLASNEITKGRKRSKKNSSDCENSPSELETEPEIAPSHGEEQISQNAEKKNDDENAENFFFWDGDLVEWPSEVFSITFAQPFNLF